MEVSKKQLQYFLKRIGVGVSASLILVGTLSSDAAYIEKSFEPLVKDISNFQYSPIYSGPYFIEYHGNQEEIEEELDKSNFYAIFSIMVQASIYHDTLVGDHQRLSSALSEFDYVKLFRDSRPRDKGSVQIFLVPVPASPDKIMTLLDKMGTYSCFYFTPDGSKIFHSGNYHRGRGLQFNDLT